MFLPQEIMKEKDLNSFMILGNTHTSTDYNHYTKRLLLSAVLASTTLYVFSQETYSADTTHDFLNRRIENVLQINKFKAKIKKIGL